MSDESLTPDTEREFVQAMRDIYLRAKNELGYAATYFLRMLSTEGMIQTARRLIISLQPSEGFTRYGSEDAWT